MPKSNIGSKLRAVSAFVLSRKMIPVLKGTLAYLIALSLILTKRFTSLNEQPLTLSSMIVISIAGGAGGSVGACVQGSFLAFIGVLVGGLGFFILANLHESHVAQGFVFAIFVYLAALVKAQGLKYFGMSLFAVLIAFNGIYTSVLLGTYSASYLKSYLEAYFWGGAIVLSVNLLVFPHSSEKELRSTLVLSVDHLATFAHLLSKSYCMDITDEEKQVREHLAQSLRADFGLLTQKIAETAIEINYSRFSLADYQSFVVRTRALQLAMMSAHSNLTALDRKDQDLFKAKFLPSTIVSFSLLRRSIEITMREIMRALACEPLDVDSNQPGYCEFMDQEREREPRTTLPEDEEAAMDRQLETVARRLAAEVGGPEQPDGYEQPSETSETAASHSPNSRPTTGQPTAAITPATSDVPDEKKVKGRPHKCGVKMISPTFEKFAEVQHDILSELLATGALHGKDQDLRVHLPQASVADVWGSDGLRERKQPAPMGRGAKSRADSPASQSVDDVPAWRGPRGNGDTGLANAQEDSDPDVSEEDTEANAAHHSLLRVYSFLFATRIYVHQLELFHKSVIRFDEASGKAPPRRLQIHMFQSLQRPEKKAKAALDYTPPVAKFHTPAQSEAPSVSDLTRDEDAADARDLSVKEALALLEGRTYTPTKVSLGQHAAQLEHLARSPTSVFALKVAAGATVFAMLIFAETTRAFFITYALTGGVLTLIVSIAPTLGQSLLTFTLQIAGSGIGYLWGVALLEMFRGVGGYHFNPFGMISLLGVTALPAMYLVYNRPQFFVFSLLALNACGILIVTEWIYTQDLGRTNFDSPILRAGKAGVALGIALGVAVIFQVFILRNPARTTLRKSQASLAYSLLSYATLFQAYVRAVIPASVHDQRAPRSALLRVEKELVHRELKIQADIIATGPLMAFAAAEPEFSTPFRPDLASKAIRAIQVVLDRLKEARGAIGHEPAPAIITRELSSKLSPYRRRNVRLINASLFLCASCLMSKAPMPTETPAQMFMMGSLQDFLHDALVISSRISHTDEGREAILNGELTRYWAYVMTVTSVGEQLAILEDVTKQMFGDLESKIA